jgi:hypothetical protein
MLNRSTPPDGSGSRPVMSSSCRLLSRVAFMAAPHTGAAFVPSRHILELRRLQELSCHVGVRYQDVDPSARDGAPDGVQFAHAPGDADTAGYSHHGFGLDGDHSLLDDGLHRLAVDVEET